MVLIFTAAPGRIAHQLLACVRDLSVLLTVDREQRQLTQKFVELAAPLLTSTVRDALLELNRRCGARGEKIVVKLMLDRGTPDASDGALCPPDPSHSNSSISMRL